MQFSLVNNFGRSFESNYIMTRIVPPKFLFRISTHAVVFTLSMPHFKKYQCMLNSCLLMMWTLSIKISCWFELPHTPIRPNLVLYKCYPALFEQFIDQTKEMIKKLCFILTIITDIKMVQLNHITWFWIVIPTINVHMCMPRQEMHEYRNLHIQVIHY